MKNRTLRQVDLNLLVILKALLDECSVTRAATKLSMTQPAMSHALARLRDLFEDPLFVRTSSGLTPTSRAEELRMTLDDTLSDISSMLVPSTFDPLSAKETMSISAMDIATQTIMLPVINEFYIQAPGIDLEIRQWDKNASRDLERGKLDLILGVYETPPRGLMNKRIEGDDFVCVMRTDHPLASRKITMRCYVDAQHVLITISGRSKGAIDRILESKNHKRRIALRIPHFASAMEIVKKSDLITTVPRRAFKQYIHGKGLIALELPFPAPTFSYAIFWHECKQHDLAHQWFRNFLHSQLTAVSYE